MCHFKWKIEFLLHDAENTIKNCFDFNYLTNKQANTLYYEAFDFY